MTFACKTETLGSLYSHALLILSKSSKSKNQVVHKKKFKDPLSSTCQISSERKVLDSESVATGSVLNEGNILLLNSFLFSCSKASDSNIGVIANFV